MLAGKNEFVEESDDLTVTVESQNATQAIAITLYISKCFNIYIYIWIWIYGHIDIYIYCVYACKYIYIWSYIYTWLYIYD